MTINSPKFLQQNTLFYYKHSNSPEDFCQMCFCSEFSKVCTHQGFPLYGICNLTVLLEYFLLHYPTRYNFGFVLQRKGIFKRPKGKRGCIEVTTPEVKLLLIFLYFTLVLFVYWADFSTSLRNRNRLFTAMYDYISCVNNISYQEGSCEELRGNIYNASFPALRVIAVLMTSLVNISNVVFVLQFKDVKKRLRTLTRRFTSKNDLEGSNSHGSYGSRHQRQQQQHKTTEM